MSEWFTGSKKGLERIARRRGLAYVLFELVQNAWDTGAKDVNVTFAPVEGRPLCDVTVEDDDPDGFKDLAHAWTLFAESEKKDNPEKRGRFNLGEKLVLAICESAEIISTTGNVRFDDEGRHVGRKRTEKGSVFKGRVKMTRDELGEVLRATHRLVRPDGVQTTITYSAVLQSLVTTATPFTSGNGSNSFELPQRTPLATFLATLPTEVANDEGFLVPRQRRTEVRVFEPIVPGEGYLYEMGIPVCATGDRYDVEIMQKVPVNLERNSVSEAYLRTIRVFVLNEMFEKLTREEVTSPAVQDALTDVRVRPEAVERVLEQQFGEKRAVYDPSDREANNRLVAAGYMIIPPRAFSKAAWENIRLSGAALPSGQISPTPKPYSTDPNAPERELLAESEWTAGMRNIAEYAHEVAWRLLHQDITVRIDKGHFGAKWSACYGDRELTFNLSSVGRDFFEHGPSLEVNELLIHELAHETESNHLSKEFFTALQRLGAELTEMALRDPHFFRAYQWRPS